MIYILYVLCVAVSTVVSAFLVGQFNISLFGGRLSEIKNPTLLETIQAGFAEPKATIIIAVILSGILITIITRTNIKNKGVDSDERGITFMKNGTHGTSIWMSKNKLKEKYNISDIKDTCETVYGQLDEDGDGKRVVSYKEPPKGKASGDRNVMILGSTGSGKSFTFVRTELVNTIKRGDSFVCTDPKGELTRDIAEWCRKQGVRTWILNFNKPEYSNFWNCTKEVISPETGKLDSGRLSAFSSVFMLNSGVKKQDFWYETAFNLLQAILGYTAWNRESYIINKYISLYRELAEDEPLENIERVVQRTKRNDVSFAWTENAIYELAAKKGYSLKDIKERIKEIYKTAPKLNAEQLVLNTINFSQIRENFGSINETNMPNDAMKMHPAKLAYIAYDSPDVSAQIKSSALLELQTRINKLFLDEKLRDMSNEDEIEPRTFNREQTACFVITGDNQTAAPKKPLISLFFTFVYADCTFNYDNAEDVAADNKIENPCKAMTFMLDEFASLGVIGGEPQTFSTIMSTSRSRKFHNYIILQDITQLMNTYEPLGDNIQGCCGTILFLGGNDPVTCEFVSEFLSGEATIMNESHHEGTGISNVKDPSVTIAETQRYLLTINEARRWQGQVLLARRGENPAKLYPFGWNKLPEYEEINSLKKGLTSQLVPISKRLEEIEKAKYKPVEQSTQKQETPLEVVDLDNNEEIEELSEVPNIEFSIPDIDDKNKSLIDD